MEKVSINKNMHLSEHFTLGEVCKTSHKTADGNIPSHVAIENLKNICEKTFDTAIVRCMVMVKNRSLLPRVIARRK